MVVEKKIRKGKIHWQFFVLFSSIAVVIFSINSAYSDSVPTSIIITHPDDVNTPINIAIDSSDNIYVLDINGKISKFDKFGNVIDANFITTTGGGPQTIAIDSSDNVYVYDGATSIHFVHKYDSSGTLLDDRFIDTRFLGARLLGVDRFDNFYTVDGLSVPNRINKFDSSGTLIDFFFIENLLNSKSIAFDSSDNIYVVEQLARKVSKYDSSGNLLNGNFITGLSFPNSIAIDSSGLIYIANSGTHQVRQHDSSGTLIDANFIDSLNFPSSIAFDSSGNIYVSDRDVGILAGTIISNQDSDGDGLLDDWEINGIDGNGDGNPDFFLNGADPQHKDIFIELDFMVGQQPQFDSIENVISSFGNAPVSNPDGVEGINLHVEWNLHADDPTFPASALMTAVIDDPIPFQAEQNITEMYSTRDAFFGSKDQRLDPNSANILEAKKLAVHYSLFIHNRAGTTSSGLGEIHGNDFFVSLGSFTGGVGNHDEQAGTFMHELGHNLGLRHGGNINEVPSINFKPNYLSVMSYSFQFDDLVSSRPFDYSTEKLLTLDEDNLDESIGIPATSTLTTIYGPSPPTLVSIGGPINWDKDTDPNEIVAKDINQIGTSSGFGTILEGHDDWDSLLYDFKTSPNFAAGAQASPSDEIEITFEDLQELISSLSSRDLKIGSISELEIVRTEISEAVSGINEPEDAVKEIEKAIDNINDSLDPKLWQLTDTGEIDPLRLNPKKGNKVFNEQKDAVDDIFDSIKKGEVENPVVIDGLLDIANRLVTADKQLAEKAIDDAQLDPDSDQKKINKALKKLGEANQLVEDADSETNLKQKGKLLEKAIKEYAKSWKKAIKSIPDDDDDDEDDEDDREARDDDDDD